MPISSQKDLTKARFSSGNFAFDQAETKESSWVVVFMAVEDKRRD
jgi:hypothetical protein